jgi:predicted MFS family arabinose efflux permease
MAEGPEVTRLKGRALTDDDRYLLEVERQAEVTAIGRIEETARLLTGSISAVTGIFVAALKLGAPPTTATGTENLVWAVVLWCIAIFVCLLVLVPLPRRHGRHAPESIRQALRQAMWFKWLLLIAAVVLFGAGTVLITWLSI